MTPKLSNKAKKKAHGVKMNQLRAVGRRINYILTQSGIVVKNKGSWSEIIGAYCSLRKESKPSKKNCVDWASRRWLGSGELSKENGISVPARVKAKTAYSRNQYKDYISSSEWKAKREDLLNERGLFCEKCNMPFEKKHLHVHHLTYERLFNELAEDLIVVCVPCHEQIHGRKFKYK